MDKKTLAKMVVFILVWVNAFLAQHKLKTIPVLDETQVAMALAFAYSAYEWLKHAVKWMQDNWFKKQPAPAPAATPVFVPDPTPTAVDVTFPAAPVMPVAQAQTVESTTAPEQPQPPVQQ